MEKKRPNSSILNGQRSKRRKTEEMDTGGNCKPSLVPTTQHDTTLSSFASIQDQYGRDQHQRKRNNQPATEDVIMVDLCDESQAAPKPKKKPAKKKKRSSVKLTDEQIRATRQNSTNFCAAGVCAFTRKSSDSDILILLVKEQRKGRDKGLAFPGGKVEEQDRFSPVETALREFTEETRGIFEADVPFMRQYISKDDSELCYLPDSRYYLFFCHMPYSEAAAAQFLNRSDDCDDKQLSLHWVKASKLIDASNRACVVDEIGKTQSLTYFLRSQISKKNVNQTLRKIADYWEPIKKKTKSEKKRDKKMRVQKALKVAQGPNSTIPAAMDPVLLKAIQGGNPERIALALLPYTSRSSNGVTALNGSVKAMTAQKFHSRQNIRAKKKKQPKRNSQGKGKKRQGNHNNGVKKTNNNNHRQNQPKGKGKRCQP